MSQKAQVVLNFTNVVAGAFVTLMVDGVMRTFTGQSGTATQPYRFQVVNNSISTTMTNFVTAFNNASPNYAFNFAFSNNHLTITAKSWGDNWNFGNVSASGISKVSQLDNIVTDLVFTLDTVTPNLCFGVKQGAITTTLTGGANPFVFLWNDGSASKDRSGLSGGTYSVTVKDFYNTTRTINNIVVAEPDSGISILTDKSNVLCHGTESGFIFVYPSGGTPPYTFKWADGPTTKDRPALWPGNYSLLITDAAGCQKTFPFEITEPPVIQILAQAQGRDIILNVSGGTPGYTYKWADGPTTKDRTNLESGVYTVTVTDANGCTAIETVNLAIPKFFWSRNPVTLSLAAAAPETKLNLSFLCEVWIELEYLSGNFTKVATLEQPADENASTIFDVQDYLDAYVASHLPVFNQKTISLAGNIFKRFYLKYTEKFGEPPLPDNFSQQSTFYVLLGGLSFEEYASPNFFDVYLPVVKPFFTWDPTVKNVFQEQQEYLYFMVNDFDLLSFKVKCKIYYTDASSTEVERFNQANLNRYEVYIIPVGADQLELDTVQPGKTIESYELFIVDPANEIISEIRTFNVIQEYHANKRFFLYLNSMGGFNGLSATGKATKSLKTSEEANQKILPANYKITDGEYDVVKKTGQPEIKIPLGNSMSTEEMERLQDFALSREVYLIENGRFNKVRTNINPEIFNEMETMKDFEFTIYPTQLNNYTPRL